MTPAPTHIHLDRVRGLSITWRDGSQCVVSVATLRRWSPSADAKQLRESLHANPLAVLPASTLRADALRAEQCEPIGNYAVRLTFSDGHRSGIYSWDYLRELAQRDADAASQPPGRAT